MDQHDAYEQYGTTHENGTDEVLEMLRTGDVTREMYEYKRDDGRLPRLAPVIQLLRAQGYEIDGVGPYRMRDRMQTVPATIKATADVKNAYYSSAHWRELCDKRKRRDGWKCVLCEASKELEVHHVRYNLFREAIDDIMTVCRVCHEKIHTYSRIGFPSYVPKDAMYPPQRRTVQPTLWQSEFERDMEMKKGFTQE